MRGLSTQGQYSVATQDKEFGLLMECVRLVMFPTLNEIRAMYLNVVPKFHT